MFTVKSMKKAVLTALAIMLMITGMQSASTAAAAGIAGCLDLSGTVKDNDPTVVIGEPFALEYTLTPGGTLTQTVDRDPVDISLVLDVSGSMDYGMESRYSVPKRITVLKDSSVTLINELKKINLSDRVGLIKFDGSASKVLDLTTDLDKVLNKINGLKAEGSTNLGSGLKLANEMLAKSPAGRKKFVIALTDGYNTHYTDKYGYARANESLARQYAKDQASLVAAQGIPIYTIALGKSGGSDIDHALLQEISNISGAKKYDASDATKLAEVFKNITQEINLSGQLTGITITQLLPNNGFAIADGNTSSASITGNVLTVQVPAISYPYDASSTKKVEVKLKQTSVVGVQPFDDAALNYTNACGNAANGTITNDNELTVLGWVDVWGNLYVGEADGTVTRYKKGNMSEPQWRIKEKSEKVTDIDFVDSDASHDDDSKAVVTYADGTTSEWNLRPTAPVIDLKDADGTAYSDSGWHKGKAKIRIGGSVNQLPAIVQYLNDDFKNNASGGDYIDRYLYRVNGGAWRSIAAGTYVDLPDLGTIHIEARAYTAAVSGETAHLVGGDISSRDTKLDETGPSILLVDTESVIRSDANPSFAVTVQDADSPIQSVTLTIDGVSETVSAGSLNTFSFTRTLSQLFPDVTDRDGWKKITITAVNAAGISSNEVTRGGATKTVHFVKVNPGPSGMLESVGDYSVKASSTPVVVNLKDVADVIVADRLSECSTCTAVTLTEMKIKVVTTKADGTTATMPYTKLGASSFRVTGEGKNDIYLWLKDSEGNEYETAAPLTVNINYQQKRY